MNNLDSHIQEIIDKFTSIIVEAVKPNIELAATAIGWDNVIEKNQEV